MDYEVPTTPGPYHDARGDLWILGEDGVWTWTLRRLPSGRMEPASPRSRVPADVIGQATAPGEDVLPLVPAEPDEIEIDG